MTKAGSKPEKFKRVNFYLDQQMGCCGIGVIYQFRDDSDHYSYDWEGRRNVLKKAVTFDTREEVAEDCYTRMLEEGQNDCYSYLTLSLVSKYYKPTKKELEDIWSYEERERVKKLGGTAQFPELEVILKREGWKRIEFLNPNHGNKVAIYSKDFKEWKKDMALD